MRFSSTPSQEKLNRPLLLDEDTQHTAATNGGLATGNVFVNNRGSHILRVESDKPDLLPEGTNLAQTTFNVMKIYIGIGLLSMVYGMSRGGWLSICVLGIEAWMFGMSGYMLVGGFDVVGDAIPHTYVNLGYAAMGRVGYALVLLFSFLEFFGALCMVLLVQCQEFRALLGQLKRVGMMDIVSFSETINIIALFIVGAVATYQRLSFTSILGTLCTVAVLIALFAIIIYDPNKHKFIEQQGKAPEYQLFNLQGIPICIGIFALSLSGHSALPVLRNSMKERKKFPSVIILSFGFMFILYALTCAAGYYYFGDAASTLITADLTYAPLYHAHSILIHGFTVDLLVTFLIWLNAFTTYPLILLSVQDMVISYFGKIQIQTWHKLSIRFVLFLMSIAVCITMYSVLGYFESLSGGFSSMNCSVLLPITFYLILKWGRIQMWQRVAIICLLSAGIFIVVLVTQQSFVDLVKHFS